MSKESEKNERLIFAVKFYEYANTGGRKRKLFLWTF